MGPNLNSLLFRLASLAGLAVSACHLVTVGDPVCIGAGSCDDVTSSAWGRPLGVPLPVFGIGFFLSLLVMSLAPNATLALRTTAAIGGVIGLGLIAVQVAVLQSLCPACLVVNFLAVFTALAAQRGVCPPKAVWLWSAGVVLAASLGATIPLVLSARQVPPPEVLALRVPGKITVVEITDPDCRYCRFLRWGLNLMEKESAGQIHRITLTPAQGEMWVLRESRGGLPAVWIGDELIRGNPSLERLRAAVRRAERRLNGE